MKLAARAVNGQFIVCQVDYTPEFSIESYVDATKTALREAHKSDCRVVLYEVPKFNVAEAA